MTTKYKTKIYPFDDNFILPVEITKETDKCIWRGSSRCLKHSDYEQYHDTWIEAKVYLLSKAKAGIENAKRSLSAAELFADKIQDLRNL